MSLNAKDYKRPLARWTTSLGVGLLPGPTGTYGSALTAACAALWLWSGGGCLDGWIYFGVIIMVTLAALAGTGMALGYRLYGESHDPGQVVADEAAGQLIAMWGICSVGWEMAGAFFLFRLFDIWKPFPVGISQDLPGAWGVVVDDLLAGLYALLTLKCLVWLLAA